MSNEVKPWPDEYGRCDWGYYQEWRHAEAYAEAAMSRLRIAVEALARAHQLVRLVTVRQAIEAGDDAINAAGLNPWCMNEGLAEGHETIGAHFIDYALDKIGELPPETGKA